MTSNRPANCNDPNGLIRQLWNNININNNNNNNINNKSSRSMHRRQARWSGLSMVFVAMMALTAVLILNMDSAKAVTTTTSSRIRMMIPASLSSVSSRVNLAGVLRGGAEEQVLSSSSSSNPGRKRKRRKKSRIEKSTSTTVTDEQTDGRDMMNAAMKEKDAATSLGDAIRQRGDILRADPLSFDLPHYDSRTYRFDASLHSLGTALGCSTTTTTTTTSTAMDKEGGVSRMMDRKRNDGGGVEVSSSAVLAQYFLKSHGGAHGIQCLASLLAVLYGTLAMVLVHKVQVPSTSSSSTSIVGTMMRRCLLSAMAKHFSGLLAAAWLSAQRIPRVGLRNTKHLIHNTISTDPVSQYLFYCSLWILYLSTTTTSTTSTTMRYYKMFVTCLIGPIWTREVVSTLLVLSDIVVLSYNSASQTLPTWYKLLTNKALDQFIMPLIIGKHKWKQATLLPNNNNNNNNNMFAAKQMLLAEW
eukprot:CAMPEP_0197826752 /NCGR_PEP_ID=MMETSP1437-20131217/3658_1 /TAXON_ID=49252 ORGANISM="Eucampia antarctica, Strain CCMP1452" /NCGR_SAMPLE_ID=MMETSP1437 /ASSEMBLY_ACC=CAM_ASM_001096 /LENGTH=470 /DNA_ID=CAMNT_0043427321 /DNA_START=43 /DNA_END=1452 /DNA_ORIENTATION=+